MIYLLRFTIRFKIYILLPKYGTLANHITYEYTFMCVTRVLTLALLGLVNAPS